MFFNGLYEPKLIVKNFGSIKEVEIDLTKFVVFIGDTSTGKSVLGKLISIFRDSKIIFNLDEEVLKKSLFHFNIDYDLQNSMFSYQNEYYNIIINLNNLKKIESEFFYDKIDELKLNRKKMRILTTRTYLKK